jgi:PAS domain S-box-containing protein
MNRFGGPDAILEALLDRLPVGILVHEGDTGACILANPVAADIFGKSMEALRQQPFHAFVSDCRLDEAAPGNNLPGDHEVRWKTTSGNSLTLALSLNRFDYKGKPYWLSTISNITETKRTQTKLEKERALLRCVIDFDHLNLLKQVDRVNRAIQANSQLERMMIDVLDAVLSIFGCHRAFLLYPCDPRAQTFKIVMERTDPDHRGVDAPGVESPIDPEIAETFRLLLASDHPVRFGPQADLPLLPQLPGQHGCKSKLSMALHPRMGKPWELGLLHCTPDRVWTAEQERLFQEVGHRLADGLGAMLAQRDLRRSLEELDQRVLDRTAQLAAANKELEAFAYSVSHDLRAPLRHIDGYLELLKNKTRKVLDDQSRHHMEAIAGAAQKMGVLIDDLLTFSRKGRQAMSMQQVALGPLVRDVLKELEPDAVGRTIVWRIGELPMVRGDKAMLRMVLINLTANALKFTRSRRQAEIEIGSLPVRKAESVIYVRDNGAGFDMAYADKLFGVFQRLHRDDEFEGIGIGLANVHRIITRHGGRAWAEGEVGRGATFYFSLPTKRD